MVKEEKNEKPTCSYHPKLKIQYILQVNSILIKYLFCEIKYQNVFYAFDIMWRVVAHKIKYLKTKRIFTFHSACSCWSVHPPCWCPAGVWHPEGHPPSSSSHLPYGIQQTWPAACGERPAPRWRRWIWQWIETVLLFFCTWQRRGHHIPLPGPGCTPWQNLGSSHLLDHLQ